MTNAANEPDPVADAVQALTAAARLTYTTPSGETTRRDFGETACHVLAAVAANLGGVDALLAGRPGSWEADLIRQVVEKTAGETLAPWRTEPIRVSIDLYAQFDRLAELYELTGAEEAFQAVHERVSAERYLDHPAVQAATDLPAMPRFDGDDGLTDAERTAAFGLIKAAYLVVDGDPEVQSARANLTEATARRDAALTAWGAEMLAAVTAEVRRRGYTCPVEAVDASSDDLTAEEWDLSADLVDLAELGVPVPGTDILPSTVTDWDDPETIRRVTAQLAAAGIA